MEQLQSGQPSCCKALFNPRPFFTYSGTCFTSKTQVIESTTSVSSSLQMWLHLPKERLPGEILDLIIATYFAVELCINADRIVDAKITRDMFSPLPSDIGMSTEPFVRVERAREPYTVNSSRKTMD